VLGGITALVLTVYVIVLIGESHIFLGSCRIYPLPQVCSPTSPWVWVIPCASVVGAAASAIGTSMLLRHRARLLHNSAPPIAPAISR